MRCLWLTRYVPYPPEFGGDIIYSCKLIEKLAEQVDELSVICFTRSSTQEIDHERVRGIKWQILPLPMHRSWRENFRILPQIAGQFIDSVFNKTVENAILSENFDAVIIDHIGLGGVLPILKSSIIKAQKNVKIVYLSHNHERSLRMLIATNYSRVGAKKFTLWQEAAKVARLETHLLAQADIVTANTEEDAALFRADNPRCAPVVVTPGYEGPVIDARTIGPATPRRATIVGSFGWIAKQMNLEAFLNVAAPKFAAAGAELEVLGTMPDAYKAQIERAYPSVLVRGRYDEIAPYLSDTRLGIVPEQTGGGFKHKVLSYAFCRVPVAALEGSVAGMPLTDGESILYAPDMDALAETCLAALDDFDLLNRLQNSAFSAVEHAFDWADRGRILVDAISVPSAR